MSSSTEIMLFNKPPVDNIYDYIQRVPVLKEHQSQRLSGNDDQQDSEGDSDSTDSEYEQVDDVVEEKHEIISLSHRYEPVALSSEMDPIKRFMMLQNIYKTGVLPPETDPI